MEPEPPPADPASDASESGTPRWVKVFAAVALAVVVLLAILLITGGGGGHGPGRHTPSSGAGHSGPPAGVTHGTP